MEQTECFETSAYKLHTPGNYPEENIQHSEQGESLKSSVLRLCDFHLMDEHLTALEVFRYSVCTVHVHVSASAVILGMHLGTGDLVHLPKWPEKFRITLSLLEE